MMRFTFLKFFTIKELLKLTTISKSLLKFIDPDKGLGLKGQQHFLMNLVAIQDYWQQINFLKKDKNFKKGVFDERIEFLKKRIYEIEVFSIKIKEFQELFQGMIIRELK